MSSIPILRWSEEWRRPGVLRADLMAGLTGAIVVLPQGFAFAILAGLPPYFGLYTAMVPCIIAAVFGSSRVMVTGPANAISLTTMALIAPLAVPESSHYISLVLTLSFLVGLIQIAFGFGRVGKWVERVPHSVVVGFTAGAAVLIVNSQLGTVFGVEITRGLSLIDSLSLLRSLLSADGFKPYSILLVSLTLLMMRVWKPFSRWIPSMLAAVILGSLAAYLMERFWIGETFFPRVSGIPGVFPPLTLPDLSLATIQQLVGPTLIMVLLASTEAMAIGRAMALKKKDQFNADQEFVGQGLANVAGAFFSAYPSSGSFNRSGVNLAAGAQTPLAALSTAGFLVVILLFAAPLIRWLPYEVIAALLVAVAWGLIDRRQILHEWRAGPREAIPMLVTGLGTIFISLSWAVIGGICAALICARVYPNRSGD
jgi:SulP family sulfate permease